MLLRYDAGGPTYSAVVTRSGVSELGRGQKIGLRPIKTETSLMLIGENGADLSVIFRVDIDALTTEVEMGSGASWDYKKLKGRCTVITQ